jgi:hypothetical protein
MAKIFKVNSGGASCIGCLSKRVAYSDAPITNKRVFFVHTRAFTANSIFTKGDLRNVFSAPHQLFREFGVTQKFTGHRREKPIINIITLPKH